MASAKTSRMDRAKKERMYFMGRASAEDSAAAFIVTGQSGKVWTVTIPRKGSGAAGSSRNNRFRCNCPDNIIRKGTCKHMLFVCLRVLKMSEEQLKGLEGGEELLVSVLHDALNEVAPEVDEQYAAPAALKARLKSIAGDFEADGKVEKVEPRLAEVGESCPICYDDLLDDTPLVHCGYGCGKPVHSECFSRYSKAHQDRYAKSEVMDAKLKCVTCRTDWEIEPVGALGKRGMLKGRRAINLADEMPDEFEISPVAGSKSRTRGGSKAKAGSKAASSSKAGVSHGRVSKSKSANSRSPSTPNRKSTRIASQASPKSGASSKKASTRKAPARKASSRKASTGKASTGKAITAKVSTRKVASRKASRGKAAGRKTSKVQSSKLLPAVIDKNGISKNENASKARAARAARRGSSRMTRSMST